ncbi:putative jacalin-like lectin domain-containing protein [Plasmopara halstedii]
MHLLKVLIQIPKTFPTCQSVGGQGGEEFSDANKLAHGQKVTKITICYGHRVDGLGITFVLPNAKKYDLSYGSKDNCHIHQLDSDEYITHWEAHTVRADEKTKVCFIRFKTNKGANYKGGRESSNESDKAKCDAPPEYQLGGLFGRAGQEIDAVGPIWVKLNP